MSQIHAPSNSDALIKIHQLSLQNEQVETTRSITSVLPTSTFGQDQQVITRQKRLMFSSNPLESIPQCMHGQTLACAIDVVRQVIFPMFALIGCWRWRRNWRATGDSWKLRSYCRGWWSSSYLYCAMTSMCAKETKWYSIYKIFCTSCAIYKKVCNVFIDSGGGEFTKYEDWKIPNSLQDFMD